MKNSKLEKLLDELLATPRAKREKIIKEMSYEEQKEFYDYFKEQTLTHIHNLYGKSYEEKVQFREKHILDNPDETCWDLVDYIDRWNDHTVTPFLMSTMGNIIVFSKRKGLSITSVDSRVAHCLDDEIKRMGYNSKMLYLDRLRISTFPSIFCRPEKVSTAKAFSCKPGDRFGNLTLLNTDIKKVISKKGKINYYGQCQCICGKVIWVRLSHALSGNVKSCGCSAHFIGVLITKHPIYKTWSSMRERCLNRNHPSYHNYGGRGIEIGKDFATFRSFFNLMLPTWKPGLSLDRIDVNKGYTFSNVQWADDNQQVFNRRVTLRVEDPFVGDITSVGVLAKRYKLPQSSVVKSYKRGLRGIELLDFKTNYYHQEWGFYSDEKRAEIIKVINDNTPERAASLLGIRLIDVLIINYYNNIRKLDNTGKLQKAIERDKYPKYAQMGEGDRFANYIVIREVEERRYDKHVKMEKRFYVLCQCICGKEKRVNAYKLFSGAIVSCGCSTTSYRMATQKDNKEIVTSMLALYKTWSSMMARCYNPNEDSYPDYGGRGIKVSEELQDARTFNDLFSPTWKPGLSLDRIDPDGDYTRDNLRWTTLEKQSNNKRRTLRCRDVIKDEEISASILARRYEIEYAAVKARVKRGCQGIDLILASKGFYLTKWPTLLSDEQSSIIDILSRLPIKEAIKELDIELADASVIKHLHCNK